MLIVNDLVKYKCFNVDKVIENGQNLGIAGAQNIGIKEAIELGADFICLFDQDSIVPKNYVNQMIQNFNELRDKKVGLITPKIFDSLYAQFYDLG